MSKQKELAERIENIRKMQEHQERDVASAEAQASDLDAILAVSRAEHESSGSSRKLRSASDLHGPGSDSFRAARTGPALNTETAYAQNLAAAHFASPEAFSRKRSKAPPVLGPGAEALPGPRPTPTRAPSGQATGARTGAARTFETTQPETTLVIRQRSLPRDAPAPHDAEAGATRREAPRPQPAARELTPVKPLNAAPANIPRQALGEDGQVVPTDHVATTPGTLGRVSADEKTYVGRSLALPANVSVRDPDQAVPTDHIATAPGMAGLGRVTTTERTQVVRHRKIHPDSVDPDTGNVLPTDHVVTAPGMAGISSDSDERTQARITMPTRPSAHEAEPPASDPDSTWVVRKRDIPRDDGGGEPG